MPLARGGSEEGSKIHYLSTNTKAMQMRQAQALFKLASGLDLEYLERRVREEGGDIRLLEDSASGRNRGV